MQGAAASVAVGEQAEDDGAEGTHGERGGGGEDDFCRGDVKLRGERVDEEDGDEEVEGVEGPAEKAGADSVPLLGFEEGLGRRGWGAWEAPRKVTDQAF